MLNNDSNQPDFTSPEGLRKTRRLFDFESSIIPPVEAEQHIDDPKGEIIRIVKRLGAIVEDHRQSAIPLNIKLGASDIKSVIGSLRKHAKGEEGHPVPNARDEIHGYCLNRLFEELVEEPSNILYSTQKRDDTIRYDAMSASFWLECLDHMEAVYCP